MTRGRGLKGQKIRISRSLEKKRLRSVTFETTERKKLSTFLGVEYPVDQKELLL